MHEIASKKITVQNDEQHFLKTNDGHCEITDPFGIIALN